MLAGRKYERKLYVSHDIERQNISVQFWCIVNSLKVWTFVVNQ